MALSVLCECVSKCDDFLPDLVDDVLDVLFGLSLHVIQLLVDIS